MNHAELFRFEHDFVETLRCIPMTARFKLDACGIKLSLREWSRFDFEERRSLLLSPCDSEADISAYRDQLIALVQSGGQAAKPWPPGSTVPWQGARQTPDAVRAFASLVGVDAPSDLQWSQLSPLHRFALLKLSRDNHDNVNFIPALKEFGLLSAAAK